uniref:Uncharacterized protein n=1 Tax=uncultured bacterium A1Q1_fos_600 TaxID=1256587 RepID=L7VQF8_9BACT|nr:hypothetical protein [uncultured bacterium A1Q1_fos_600]
MMNPVRKIALNTCVVDMWDGVLSEKLRSSAPNSAMDVLTTDDLSRDCFPQS